MTRRGEEGPSGEGKGLVERQPPAPRKPAISLRQYSWVVVSPKCLTLPFLHVTVSRTSRPLGQQRGSKSSHAVTSPVSAASYPHRSNAGKSSSASPPPSCSLPHHQSTPRSGHNMSVETPHADPDASLPELVVSRVLRELDLGGERGVAPHRVQHQADHLVERHARWHLQAHTPVWPLASVSTRLPGSKRACHLPVCPRAGTAGRPACLATHSLTLSCRGLRSGR